MKTIVVMNQKGGVAKTTTVINTAAIMTKLHGKKVLVIDADSQANTTQFFKRQTHKYTFSDILRHEPDGGASAVLSIEPSNWAGIDLLAADTSLMDLDLSAVQSGRVYTNCLRDMVELLEAEDGGYDYCIVDCPPAFNAASAAALLAGDSVIIPIRLDAFSLLGTANMTQQISNMAQLNPALKLAGCLVTMWAPRITSPETQQAVIKSGLPLFATRIRQTPKMEGMIEARVPLIDYSPTSSAARDYRDFVAELLSEVK